MIGIQKISEEIFKECKLSSNSKESFERTMRAKYKFLIEKVVMRSKLDFNYKRKNMIPKKDAVIVKALLIKSYDGTNNGNEDQIYVDWFNGRIIDDDYDKIIELNNKVSQLLEDLCYETDMSELTCHEWTVAIESSTNLSGALNTKKLLYEMDVLNNQTIVLNHLVSFGDIINDKNEHTIRLSIIESNFKEIMRMYPNISLDTTLGEMLEKCIKQSDYINMIIRIMQFMEKDACDKTIEFIKSYAEIKKTSKVDNIDELMPKDTLASEYMKLFQNIYEFLKEHQKLTNDIEKEIGVSKLLDFFKVKDRK